MKTNSALAVLIVVFFVAACSPGGEPALPTPTTTPAELDRDITITFAGPGVEDEVMLLSRLIFIDTDAEPLQEINLAAPEAESILGAGWVMADAGIGGGVRWAGGSQLDADLEVTAPPETEGILIEVRAARSSTIFAAIGDRPPAMARLSGDQRLLYLAFGPPDAELVSEAEPVWSEGRAFPGFPITDHVYAIRVVVPREVYFSSPASWRINASPVGMAALTLAGMQGVINRSGPRVFLDWIGEDWEVGDDYVGYWARQVSAVKDVTYLDLDPESAVRFLWRRFAPRFTGAVVYDPDVPHTINVATMIAGLEDRVMVAPEQLEFPGMPDFGQVYDLSAISAELGWDAGEESQLAIHEWVYENLWPQLDQRVIGIISPGPPNSGEVPGTGTFYPMGLAARDYLVALRLPVLYLNPSDPPDSVLFDQFLEEAPAPVPLTGIYQEYEPGTVVIASDHGDFVAGITWPGVALANGNLTVLGEARAIDPYQATIDSDRILATLEDRPVAMMYLKGGDALSGQLDRDVGAFMSWPEAQRINFGWTTNPTIIDLAPLVWNSDLAVRDTVTLISGISGVGYARPHRMDPQELDAYLNTTREYFIATGLRVVEVDIQEGPVEARTARAYYEALHDIGYLGILQTAPGTANFSYLGDVPAPVVSNSHVLLPGSAEALAQTLLDVQDGIVTADVGDPHGRAQTIEDPQGVEGDAVVYRRADLGPCCLATVVSVEALVPGTYTATIRTKTPDRSVGGDLLHFYVFDQRAEQTLASLFLSPADFAGTNSYQEFTVSFDAAQSYLDLEVRVDYLGGDQGLPEVEIMVDTISFGSQEGPALPPFTTVFVDDHPDLTEDLPREFQTLFEDGGGLLLTPDEFFAALNPEFMLEFAIPILGADHPAVLDAAELMAQNDFLLALLRIREGLKQSLTQ